MDPRDDPDTYYPASTFTSGPRSAAAAAKDGGEVVGEGGRDGFVFVPDKARDFDVSAYSSLQDALTVDTSWQGLEGEDVKIHPASHAPATFTAPPTSSVQLPPETSMEVGLRAFVDEQVKAVYHGECTRLDHCVR